MRRFRTTALLLCLSFSAGVFASGCGSSKDSSSGGGDGGSDDSSPRLTLGGNEFVITSDQALQVSGDRIAGTGVVAFKSPLGTVSSNRNFRLTASLLDGGTVELRTFASASLEGGLFVAIARRGDSVVLLLSSSNQVPVERELGGVDAKGTFTVSIDVHNKEKPAHVLAWSESETAPNDDNALFNSDADGRPSGNGVGPYWGLRLDDATVFSVSLGAAMFSH